MAIGNTGDTKRLFINVTNGQFKYRQSKEAPYEFANFVEGKYLYHTYHWKENKDKPKFSKQVLQIALADPDGTLYLVETTGRNEHGMSTVYAWMFASFLTSIRAGDTVRLRTWKNDDNEKVSVCWIEKPEGSGVYTALSREQFPSDLQERTEMAENIITTHSAFLDPEAAKQVKGAEADPFSEDEAGTVPIEEANPTQAPKATATSAPAEQGGAETAEKAAAAGGETSETPIQKAKRQQEADKAAKGKNSISKERAAYFDVMDAYGLKGMDITDHRDMVASVMAQPMFGSIPKGDVKSFNDVDDKAVEWFTKWLGTKWTVIEEGPTSAGWKTLPPQIRAFLEAKAAAAKPASATPISDGECNPFGDE